MYMYMHMYVYVYVYVYVYICNIFMYIYVYIRRLNLCEGIAFNSPVESAVFEPILLEPRRRIRLQHMGTAPMRHRVEVEFFHFVDRYFISINTDNYKSMHSSNPQQFIIQ